MRRFRRVRGRRVLVAGAWVLCGVMLSCPVPFCPAPPRPAPSGKPPFSAFPRFAVWRNALLGMSSAGARRTAREPAPIGGGSRSRPRSRARRPAPRPPVPARGGPPRREPLLPGREKPRTPTTADSEARGRSRASVPERGEGRRVQARWGLARCPGIGASRCARDAPSGKPPFSAFPRLAVWKSALLGKFSVWAGGRGRGPAPIGGGSRTRPRSRARRPAPRPPVPASPPRTATSRTRKTANADNRRFRGSRPFAREGPGAWGSGLADWAGMTVARGRISHLPSAEKNTPLGECPQLTVSF